MLPFVQEKYSRYSQGEWKPSYQSNRKLLTLSLSKDATVTYGKTTITVKYDASESEAMVLDVTGDEYLYVYFSFSERLTLTADSSLESGDVVVGGTLYGIGSKGNSHLEMRGTWPTVTGSFLQSGDRIYKDGCQTDIPIPYFIFSGQNLATLAGMNMPLTTSVSNLILEGEEVSIQGLFGWTGRAVTVNLTSPRTVFRVMSDIQTYMAPEIEVNGGALTILQSACEEKSAEGG